jgi:predicted TIM-barrel fold metal-dependent hydrolase
VLSLQKFHALKAEILKEIEDIPVVDNHEHLFTLFKENPFEIDLPFFLARGYIHSDLVSSGLPESFYEPSNKYVPEVFSYLIRGGDEKEKSWSQLKPYLERVKNTVYYQYLLIALRDLYGFEGEEFGEDWVDLSDQIRAQSRKNPNWGLELLEKIGVYKIILDIMAGTGKLSNQIVEDEKLVQVVRMDGFITGDENNIIGFKEGSIRDLEDYLILLDEAFQEVVKGGAVGIKSGLAYKRVIRYQKVPRYKAERILMARLKDVSSESRKTFQDFMMHEVCKRCAKYNLPFQIHTGIQAGNYNIITNANPTHLTNLLRQYPEVRFDIFHGGYPYCRQAGILAKYFPNAYIDGSWLAHISPSAYKQALNEWLEIVPATKIFAWGGDHTIPEHTYASLRLARELIAEVLTANILNQRFSKKTAIWTAERILDKNAREVYQFAD